MDDYQRNEIKDLIKLNKPFIVKGTYIKLENENEYVTIHDIYPFSQNQIGKYCFCNHINIFQTDLIRIYGTRWPGNIQDKTSVYLVCRPYTYSDKFGIMRGGLALTDEFNQNPVKLSQEEITEEEKKQCIDFFQVNHGCYMTQYLQRKKYKPAKQAKDKLMRHSKRAQKEKKRKQQLAQRNATHVSELIKLLESQREEKDDTNGNYFR